jgi:hypothetical protein
MFEHHTVEQLVSGETVRLYHHKPHWGTLPQEVKIRIEELGYVLKSSTRRYDNFHKDDYTDYWVVRPGED